MLLLCLGLIIFFAIHLVPTSPTFRDGLIDRFGANAYKLAFAVLSAVGLALIVLGYHKLQLNPGKNPVLWTPPEWTRRVTWALMLPAIILFVAAYVPSRIRTVVKHPMLAGLKLWALAHLISNGDLGSLALFGSFLAFGVYDRISVKRRAALGPLGARDGNLAGDVIVVGLGLLLYGYLLTGGHEAVIGVSTGFPAAP